MAPTALDVRDSVDSQRTDDVERRVLDATMVCVTRFGVAKTTIDDVAREAGCSRATVYRYFANRPALITAAVEAEIESLVATVIESAADAEELEDAVTAMFVTAARRIISHEALQRALTHEPEIVLPALSFEGGDRVLARASDRFAPTLARFVPPDRASRAAEWCTRVLLAYLHPDRTPILLTDEPAARRLVRRHVVPALSRQPAAVR
jgi:AcrR family transcriptional regulator